MDILQELSNIEEKVIGAKKAFQEGQIHEALKIISIFQTLEQLDEKKLEQKMIHILADQTKNSLDSLVKH